MIDIQHLNDRLQDIPIYYYIYNGHTVLFPQFNLMATDNPFAPLASLTLAGYDQQPIATNDDLDQLLNKMIQQTTDYAVTTYGL